jgi:hypothetical protein
MNGVAVSVTREAAEIKEAQPWSPPYARCPNARTTEATLSMYARVVRFTDVDPDHGGEMAADGRYGSMFWFSRKKFVGSYARLS